MRAVALAFATSLGVGYVPVAPGTFGSLAGLVLWWFLPPSAAVQAAAILALFVIGSWSATVAEQAFAKTDPGQVVIDEVMGMLITLFMFPVGWFARRRRIFPVPPVRHRQTVSGQSLRASLPAAWA